ncbi:biotin/lipoyl-binding protein, partial [bacterium]|nr:biotin/lipoyl-binding protein [bacterium]
MKKKVPLLPTLPTAAAAVVWLVTRRTGDEGGTVAVSGTIEVTEVEVSFKVPGRVRERLVDEGEQVKAGQIIARLDDDDLRLEVAQRERDTEAVAANLRELEAGYRKEDIARADAAVSRVRADAERLKADFARQEALYRREVISRRDFDAAKAAFESSQAALREAVAQQELMHRGPRSEQIDAARARLGQAREALELSRTRLGYATLAAP